MKQIKVEIKKQHIENGVRKSTSRCPIGLALSEMFPDKEIVVFWSRIGIGDEIYIPDNEQFSVNFDANFHVEPTTIILTQMVRINAR